MTASDICGAWGGCPLPKGHNMGRLDIPENHAAPPAPDPAWVEAGVAALGIDFVDPLAVEAVIAAVEPLIRREVLADLRAKVEGLHRAVIDGEPHIRRGEALALFDGAAQRGSLLDNYDPVPGLVARGVMSDEHDPDSCEMDCCREVRALRADLAECREEAHRMIEAARSEIIAWRESCEEFGHCVPEAERVADL